MQTDHLLKRVIHSFIPYLLSTYYDPGRILEGDKARFKTNSVLASMHLLFSGGRHNKRGKEESKRKKGGRKRSEGRLGGALGGEI